MAVSTLKARGISTKRWEKWRARQRDLVMEKRGNGDCEARDTFGKRCAIGADQWHHCFGRGHVVAEPLASHHTMTCGLCFGHHRHVHTKPAGLVARVLKSEALIRGAAWFALPTVQDVRELERVLRMTGAWEQLLADAGR